MRSGANHLDGYMKLSNQLGLPEPLVEAIRNDSYDPGDCEFTTGQLIRPVRINSLTRRYGDQISEDASDRIFALLGQAIHTILERAGNQDSEHDQYVVEKRYFVDFEGTKISGQIDVFDSKTKVLSDYKLCSRYEADREIKPEWVQQANINAFLMRQNGHMVVGMQIVAIFRDWSKMMAARKDDYPQGQVKILEVESWPEEKTIDFIRARIQAHRDGVDDPPLCTPKERWTRPTQWALMKKGQKRAVKLFEDHEKERAIVAASVGYGVPKDVGKYSVVERPGEDVRCKYYCGVARFCDYGKLVLEQ